MPTDEQALMFATMLKTGLPAHEAILYFYGGDDPGEQAMMMTRWLKSAAVRRAQHRLMGKSWQDMELRERIELALDQHYSGMAWMLFSSHYAEASSLDKGKLDAARMALEAKQAGTAGKQTPLDMFFQDINAGKFGDRFKTLAKPTQN